MSGVLTAKLLAEDPIVLAVTAESVHRLHPADEWPNGGGVVGKATQIFFLLVQHVRGIGDDARALLVGVEGITRADPAALLDNALDLWTLYGPNYPFRAARTPTRTASHTPPPPRRPASQPTTGRRL